jgi:hypothetical protein
VHDLTAHVLQDHRFDPCGLSLHRRQHRGDEFDQPLVRSEQTFTDPASRVPRTTER